MTPRPGPGVGHAGGTPGCGSNAFSPPTDSLRGLTQPFPASHISGTRGAFSAAASHRAVTSVLLSVGILLCSGWLAGLAVGHTSATTPRASPSTGFHNNGVSPPPLESASGVFDAADGYVVMFGGRGVSGAMSASTWSFAGGNWSRLSVVGGITPPARYEAPIAYDAADGEAVLFGGCGDSACHQVLNDTWSFAHGRWTNLTPLEKHEPPARDRAMMVDDVVDGHVLLFGGLDPNGQVLLPETWTFHAGQWSPPNASAPSGPVPSGRAGAAMVYDAAHHETVLFGGLSSAGVVGDTWTYRGGNWTNVTTGLLAAPDARWLPSAAYDSEQQVPLLVNGYNHGSFKSGVWAFAGNTWTQLSDSGGPDASYGGLLVDDPADGYMLYFSGVVSGSALLTSTFLYYQGGWQLLINPPGSSGLGLLGILLPLLILPIIFGVMLPLAHRAQRRRELQLAAGVAVVPGEIVSWIETPRPWSLYGGQALVFLIFLVFPVAFVVPLLASGTSVSSLLVVGGISIALYGFLSVVLYTGMSRSMTRAIAIVDGGVIVRRSRGELRVGWDNLQPSLMKPRKGRYWFQFLFPGKEQGQGGFVVTVDQARAILLDPRAPPWVVPRLVSEELGIPFRSAQSVPVPGLPLTLGQSIRRNLSRAPYSPGSSGANWPPPGAPPPLGRTARPATFVAAPPPMMRPPTPIPAAPRAPPPPPPGTVACRNCGQLNPVGRVAFCRSCGQRLS
jgi:hypothetical protein